MMQQKIDRNRQFLIKWFKSRQITLENVLEQSSLDYSFVLFGHFVRVIVEKSNYTATFFAQFATEEKKEKTQMVF